MTNDLMTPEEYKAAARVFAKYVLADLIDEPLRELARRIQSQTPRGIVAQGIKESQERRGVVG